MAEKETTKSRLDQLTSQEEKILRLLREERRIVREKFPLPYALFATFGVVTTWAGLNRIVQEIPFLYNNPVFMIILGVSILLVTGAAYKRLG